MCARQELITGTLSVIIYRPQKTLEAYLGKIQRLQFGKVYMMDKAVLMLQQVMIIMKILLFTVLQTKLPKKDLELPVLVL